MKPTILKLLGQRIRDLRKALGLSQEELAEKAGCHFSYIGGIERAEKNISILNLEKIASALGVNVVELLSYGKHIRSNKSNKDVLINQLNQKLVTLKVSDLQKLDILLNEFFE
ncbi:MAG: helix-turn-helix domain-containing protein [Candidatus Pristimantibacillus sp.]